VSQEKEFRAGEEIAPKGKFATWILGNCDLKRMWLVMRLNECWLLILDSMKVIVTSIYIYLCLASE